MQGKITRIAFPVFAVSLAFAWAQRSAEGVRIETEEAHGAAVVAQELSCYLQGATLEGAQARPSPLRQVSFTFDGGEGLLCYGAPSARGRKIMGGLVPFGQPWRAGANEATSIHLSAATSIGKVSLEAGSYSMYTIPGEGEWEFFLNSSHERWGTPINDAVRSTEVGSFTVTAEATDGMVETLTFSYANGAIVMAWENTRLRIPIG